MTARRQISDKALLAGLAAVALPLLGVLVRGLVTKGVWFDELWSKWMVSRELGFGDAAQQRWFQDVHPPLFYAFNWLATAGIGPDVVAHRWLNLAWLAGLAGLGVWLGIVRPAMRPALVVGALLLLSNRDIVLFAEYRSYALIVCATAALMLLLGEMLARSAGPSGRDLTLPRDRTLAVLLVATILLVLNLHYIATAITAVTIGVFMFDRLRAGHRRWAALLFVTGCIAMLPIFAALWAERPYMAAAVPDYWVKTSVAAAAKMMAGKIGFATGLNAALLVALVLVALGRGRGDHPSPLHWRFAALTAIAVLLACLLLLGVNIVKPVIVPRYLIALSPIVITALAVVAADRLVAQRWLFIAFLVNAAIVGLVFIRAIPAKPAWDEGAARVAAIVKACPATRVYTMWRMDGLPLPKFTALPNEVPFITWAMADLGKDYGLAPRFVTPAKPPAALALSPVPCPTVLWIEHAAALDGPRTAAVAGLSADSAALHTEHTGTGTIIVLPASR